MAGVAPAGVVSRVAPAGVVSGDILAGKVPGVIGTVESTNESKQMQVKHCFLFMSL